METEYNSKKKPLVNSQGPSFQSFFWKSYVEFDQDDSEITLKELIPFLLKMTYVQALNLIFVYIIAFLTFYLESFQNLLINNNSDFVYQTFVLAFIILFFIILCTRKIKNMIIKLILLIILSLVVIILFGNILGLIVIYFPKESTIMFLVYILLTSFTMLISFIMVLKIVSPEKFTFEKLVAASTLSQLILFIIFISIYSQEWLFIVIIWIFHYLYCLCFVYELLQISTGYNKIIKIQGNNTVDYLMAGLIVYVGTTCLSIDFVPIITLFLIFESMSIMFCKTDEKYI
ncbi:unnamed protein product [Paramecium primaurelia]|uniref:Transmembrane protein n=1 Tax=Paramecium primaurelia TaxID=5886 RepID=A0A8S1Q739_PARPR|nr:unnamed protein product [Paramecium primaurelia]